MAMQVLTQDETGLRIKRNASVSRWYQVKDNQRTTGKTLPWQPVLKSDRAG